MAEDLLSIWGPTDLVTFSTKIFASMRSYCCFKFFILLGFLFRTLDMLVLEVSCLV